MVVVVVTGGLQSLCLTWILLVLGCCHDVLLPYFYLLLVMCRFLCADENLFYTVHYDLSK